MFIKLLVHSFLEIVSFICKCVIFWMAYKLVVGV